MIKVSIVSYVQFSDHSVHFGLGFSVAAAAAVGNFEKKKDLRNNFRIFQYYKI